MRKSLIYAAAIGPLAALGLFSCGGKAVIDGGGGAAASQNSSVSISVSSVAVTTGGGTGLRECNVDADCTLSNGCCACAGYPVGGDDPDDQCAIDCDQPACDAFPVIPSPLCVRGQCVIDVECRGQVLCNALPPDCGERVPSVVNECWGPCVDAFECPAVAGCETCPNGTFCLGAPGSTHCIPNPTMPPCNPLECSCVESLCEDGEACTEAFGDPPVSCAAPQL